MVNNAISIFPFLVFEKSLSLDVIFVIQSNNILFFRSVITYLLICIMYLRSVFPEMNVDHLFLPVILVFKYHLLKIL